MDMWVEKDGQLLCADAPSRRCPLQDICEDSNRCVIAELRCAGFSVERTATLWTAIAVGVALGILLISWRLLVMQPWAH